MTWSEEEYMPPKRSAKRTQKKDAEQSELGNQIEDVIKEKANNFWSCTGPIIINNNHGSKKKERSIPEDPSKHWTYNRYDIRWLHLWHIEQQINRLQFEFHKTVNWNAYKTIHHLNKSKETLISQGIILETISTEELLKQYYNYGISTVKNYNNHYFQYCYYTHPEEGEIIEEVSSYQGKKVTNGNKY
jgi:hypothetical protein